MKQPHEFIEAKRSGERVDMDDYNPQLPQLGSFVHLTNTDAFVLHGKLALNNKKVLTFRVLLQAT